MGGTGSGLTIDFGRGRYQSSETLVQDGAFNGGTPANPKTPIGSSGTSLFRSLFRTLLAWILLTASLPAADNSPIVPDYSVRPWRLEDGLPFETVTALHQGRDGHLWLGTDAGTVRFDGVQFQTLDHAALGTFPLTRISHISEDASGRIWFATSGGGVVCKIGPDFKHFGPAQGLSNEHVKVIAHGRDNAIWVGTDGGGLFHWVDDRFVSIPPPTPLARFIVGVAETPDRQAIVATPRGGIWRWDRTTWHPVPRNGDQDSLRWSTLVTGASGRIWAGSTKGLWEYVEGRLVNVPWQDGANLAVRTILEAEPDDLWIGTTDTLHHRQGDQFISLKVGAGFSSSGTSTLLRDSEGSLWAATDGLGLAQLRQNRFATIGTPEGLSHDEVTSVCESHDGSLWVTTASGLNRLHGDGITHFSKTNGLTTDFLFSAHEDSSGRLWLGTRTAGLIRFENEAFASIPLPDHPPSIPVWCIEGDHKETVWIGTPAGLTIARKNQPMIRISGSQGLSNDDVRCIRPGTNNDLWVGTSFGLNLIRNDRVVTNWSAAAGHQMETVVSLHHDPDGTLWIGTLDRGLFRWRDGRFSHLSVQQGLIENSIHQIIDDGLGNLWFTCSRGVFSATRESLHAAADRKIGRLKVRHFTVADGLRSIALTSSVQPAGTRTRDGRLWFPSNRGLSVIDPARFHRRTPPPRPIIERVVIRGERSSFRVMMRDNDNDQDWVQPSPQRVSHSNQDPASLPRLDIREPGRGIQLPPGADFLELHFSAPSFVAPKGLRFKCQLVGFDRGWIDMGERRVAYYTRVPPGHYTFRIAAENHDGVMSRGDASLDIILLPHWYQTQWFIFALAACVVAALVSTHFWQKNQTLQRRSAQEAFARQLIASQEVERRRIASDLHDSLEQEILVIKNRADLGLDSASPAQAQQQLGQISQLAMHAIGAIREITHNLRPKVLDRLGLTRALRTLVERIEEGATCRIHADLDPIDGLLPQPDEINLYRIVQESLNNVLKHSGASRVEIRLQRRDPGILLEIEDNGCGFNPESPLHSGGFGLRGLQERARILGGSLEILSEPGRGTTVRANFPIPDKPIP
jgi:signal transduction histidine kinase/ligand-binding sensor domain-containing protein